VQYLDKITLLLSRHKPSLIESISCTYGLTTGQIERYKEVLSWHGRDHSGGLSTNEKLPWSKELLDHYKDRWEWHYISPFIIGDKIWYDGVLEDFEDYIDWYALSGFADLTWDEAFLEKYEDKIDFEQLSRNPHMEWNERLIDKYMDKLDFDSMSNRSCAPWNPTVKTVIKTREYKNYSKEQTLHMLLKYEDKINWDFLLWDWTYGLTREECDQVIEEVLTNK
jgi:hypothetical protein